VSPTSPRNAPAGNPSTQTLVDFFRARTPDAGLVDKLKIVYRPLICPFDDLLGYATRDNRVFDLGCGRGQFALLLAEFVKPRAIAGIEISEELIEKARALLSDYDKDIPIDFQSYDGVHIPEFIGGYDVVFLIDVVHHIPRAAQKTFLRNLHRCMAPGSRLIIKDIDAASPLVFANKLHDLLLAGELGHEMTQADLTQAALDAGFSLLGARARRMFWYPHFTLELRK